MIQSPLQTNNAQSLAQAPIPPVDLERKRVMKDAWKAYRGEFAKPLEVEKGKPDDNVMVNFCVSIVDKGASWLFGQPLKIEASEEVASAKKPPVKSDPADPIQPPETPIQDFLDGMWGDDDDKMSLLSDDSTNGGVCGQGFIKLIPPQGQMKYPRLVVMDPQIVRIVTAPDDCSLILAYIIEYPGPGDIQKRQIIARIDPDGLAGIAGEYDLDDTWTITNYIRRSMGGQQSSWQPVGAVETWPWPFPPIFTNKNLPNPNESWGIPDLTPDLIDQNKTLIFLFSNLSRIIKYHGHPKTWAKGLHAAQIETAIDDIIVLASDAAEIGVLLPMDNFAGILSVIAAVMSNIDQQSRIPGVALGRQDVLPRLGNISGVALSLMFQPFIEKTMTKQRLYGRTIRDISRAALVIAGLIKLEEMDGYKIGLHWSPLLPNDNLVAAQEALILQQLGVSMSTILAGLNIDADDEATKKAAEDEKALTNFSQGKGMPPQPAQPVPVAVPGQAQQVIQQDAQQTQKAGLAGNGQ